MKHSAEIVDHEACMQPKLLIMKHSDENVHHEACMQPTSLLMKHAADIVIHEACMQPTSFIIKHAADIVHHERCSRHRSSWSMHAADIVNYEACSRHRSRHCRAAGILRLNEALQHAAVGNRDSSGGFLLAKTTLKEMMFAVFCVFHLVRREGWRTRARAKQGNQGSLLFIK